MEPQHVIYIAAIFGSTVVLVSAMGFVSRLMSQRRLKAQDSAADEVARRLERMEQAMDAMATEVERLGETSRFVAKLLSEKKEALPRQASNDPPNVA